MSDDELKQLIASNAKAIEALASTVADEKKERQRMYQSLAKMADAISWIGSAQATFWEVQADYYRRLEEMDERQEQYNRRLEKITEILDRLSQQD